MKKRGLIAIVTLFVLVFCFTACGKDEPAEDITVIADSDGKNFDEENDDSNAEDAIKENEENDDSDIENDTDSDDVVFEEETFEETTTAATVEETEVVPAPCSLCGEAKDCDIYEVDGQKYLVCDYCYPEFAGAFGLED